MEDLNSVAYSGKAVADAVAVKTASGGMVATFELVQERKAPDGQKVEKLAPFWVGGPLALEAVKKVKQYTRVFVAGRLTSNSAGLVVIVDGFVISVD